MARSPPDPGCRSRLPDCRYPCGVAFYTAGAERVYARAGWHSVETVQRHGRRPVTLMRRDLTSADLDPADRDL